MLYILQSTTESRIMGICVYT